MLNTLSDNIIISYNLNTTKLMITITESVLINASLKKVWDTFTDLTCWKNWNTVLCDISCEAERLTEGKRFRFCIRPFDIPVRIEPVVEEIVPENRIVWSGRKHGITARHEFTFKVEAGQVLLTSAETFSGALFRTVKFIFPRRKIKELSRLMLYDIKSAAEKGEVYRP